MDVKSLVPQPIKNSYHLLQSYWTNLRYSFPAENLKIIGVTGTDGKTTTAIMIYSILKQAGLKVGLISTISAKIGNKELDTGLHVTTPDPWEIPRLLRIMVDAGIKWVVLETTSHALDQNRVAYIQFEKAVFTNITFEHLDYHKTWRSLALAKTKLINLVKEGGEIIYNQDEKGAKFIKKQINKSPQVLLSVICSDTLVKKKEISEEGLKFNYEIKGKEAEISIPVLGEYNITNAQCAIKTCEDIVSAEDIVLALKNFKSIKGRMQVVRKEQPCTIIVDFAHTPNALKKALITVRNLSDHKRIFVVFGCAGMRDKTKRRKMGRIAAKLADIIIITSEDPRVEKLSKINEQILEGALEKKAVLVKRFTDRRAFKAAKIDNIRTKIKENAGQNPLVFTFDQQNSNSREDAIEFAVKLAESKDIILITGKGHEKSLCFDTKEYAWSDHEAVKRAVKLKYDQNKEKLSKGKRSK